MSNSCSIRKICMFDLEKLTLNIPNAHKHCLPNTSLEREGDLCSNYSYCCVICSTKDCHAIDIEKWGFKRTLLRMKLHANTRKTTTIK